jgi:hypothetical protein
VEPQQGGAGLTVTARQTGNCLASVPVCGTVRAASFRGRAASTAVRCPQSTQEGRVSRRVGSLDVRVLWDVGPDGTMYGSRLEGDAYCTP